ncbi:MAG: hypothetical protein H5T61_03195 [Thermoflexales bacterium]|nr:hypothetical protein [Thermoflexales bacterium]
MSFQKAVAETPHLGLGAYRPGKQALGPDGDRIRCKKNGRFTGSVNLEKALKEKYPDDPLWDYGVGFQIERGPEVAFWIEVHPAYTSEVSAFLSKLAWLKAWLQGNAKALWQLTQRNPRPAYFWLASGGVHIPKGSPQARRLRQAGIGYPREMIEL